MTGPRWFIMPVYHVFAGQTICPLALVMTANSDQEQLQGLPSKLIPKIRVLDYDARFGIERIYTPERVFWIERPRQGGSAKNLIGLLAEHAWMSGNNPKNMVRQGDVVIDCGAHIGVFTHMAVKASAGTVVAVEPAPTNLECLRRNFAQEIVAGRVVVISKGVWSQKTTLRGSSSLRASQIGCRLDLGVSVPLTLVVE